MCQGLSRVRYANHLIGVPSPMNRRGWSELREQGSSLGCHQLTL